jgi:hypothetical protein
VREIFSYISWILTELGYGIKPQRLCGGSIERWWNPGVYGNRTAESRERTEDERTETTIPEAIGGLFKVGRDRDNNDIASL